MHQSPSQKTHPSYNRYIFLVLYFLRNAPLLQIVVLGLLLSGCGKSLLREHHDPFLKKSKQDYEELTRLIQDPTRYARKPQATPLKQSKKQMHWPSSFEKKITVSFSDQVPLKEIFEALSKQAKVSLAIESSFSKQKGVFYNTYQQPIKQIIQTICRLTGTRYKLDQGVLIIQEDRPFLKTYTVPFLSGTRQNQNRASVSTDVLGATNEKNTATDNNGSETLLSSHSIIDFWGELEGALKLILNAPQPHTIAQQKETKSPASSNSYALHKQAGMLSVFGTQLQHELVEDYLEQLKNLTSTQIMIEAKIIEVSLSDQNQTGINWSRLGNRGAVFAPFGEYSPHKTALGDIKPDKNLITLAFKHGDFSSILKLMEQFGTTRTLSSPRMTVLNNQPALFKFAKNEVFFRLDVERLIPGDGKPDVENTTSQIQTIPIGLVMVVQPSVNLETHEITLTLRPSISKIVGMKEDPAVAMKSKNKISSKIPVVQIREMDSVLKIHSGEVVVMGGFMEETVGDNATGVPGLQDVPLFGNLFQAKEDERHVTELVIFLKASVVQQDDIHPADHRLYQRFSQDPRPLF